MGLPRGQALQASPRLGHLQEVQLPLGVTADDFQVLVTSPKHKGPKEKPRWT